MSATLYAWSPRLHDFPRAARRFQLERAGAELLHDPHAQLQANVNDCGPAALANLLALLGRPVPALDSVALLTGLELRGSTFDGLKRAAGRLGTELVQDSGGLDALRARLPALVWINESHFAVVARMTGSRVEVIDPLVGRYRTSAAQFQRDYSGFFLTPAR